MTRRVPRPAPGKTLVGFDEIPDWVDTFSVPDDFDLDNATSAEIRADERMMADAPFNPNAEIEAGTL